jgi:hypothetical protein
MNFVAVRTKHPSKTDGTAPWWESISPASLEPANLHAAQFSRRLSEKK